MIQTVYVDYKDRVKNRKVLKQEWLSSVALCKKYNTKYLRSLCDMSLEHHAIKLNISGSIKYWFHKELLEVLEHKANLQESEHCNCTQNYDTYIADGERCLECKKLVKEKE